MDPQISERKKQRPLAPNGYRALGSRIVAGLILLFRFSYRMEICESDLLTQWRQTHPHKPLLFAAWHEHIWILLCVFRGRPLVTLTSRSGGGRFVGAVAQHLGYRVVHGSSGQQSGTDKGGGEALLRLLRQVRAGSDVVITVDGSTGPAHQAKPGIVELALRCNLAIVPCHVTVARAWRLPTWDRMLIPKPFTRLRFSWAPPVEPDPTLSLEDNVARLNAAMR